MSLRVEITQLLEAIQELVETPKEIIISSLSEDMPISMNGKPEL